MQRRPHGRWAALTMAVVVAMAAASCGGSARQSASPTTQPTSVQAATKYQWNRLQSPPLTLGGGQETTIADVLAPSAPGQEWVAVGTQTSGSSGSFAATATVWTSANALTWTSSSLPAPSQSGGSGTSGVSQARSVARLGGSLIVVGSVGTGSSERAAVWVSRGAGQSWRDIASSAFAPVPGVQVAGTVDAATSGQGAVMNTVATGAIGAFAAGTVRGAAALWYSTDGTRWTRLTAADKLVDSADQARITSLLVTANGVWAAGSVVSGTALDGALWNSTDGLHWGRIMSAQRSFAGNGDHVITDIAALNTGFVAVGAVRTGTQWLPASWISPDGVSWSAPSSSFPQPPPTSGYTGGAKIHAVASGTGGLAAVGGGSGVQRLWTSTDGLSWSDVPLPGAAASATGWRLGLVATYGGTTVVADNTMGQPRLLTDVGGTWTEVSANPAEFGTPAPVAVPGSLVSDSGRLYLAVNVHTPGQAIGHGRSSVSILTSANGSTWTVDASGGPFVGYQVKALLPVAGGLEAAGAGTGPDAAAAFWSSTSGRTWTAASSPDGSSGSAGAGGSGTGGGGGAGGAAFGGGASGPAAARALARLGSTLVAVGTDGGAAVSWTSADGVSWQPAKTLDKNPGLGVETPDGACAGPQSVAAVGSGRVHLPGTQAEVWSSSEGQTWQAGTVSPAATAGEEEVMTGCLPTGNAFLAYGAAAGPAGTRDPALWQSTGGVTWSRQTVAAFKGQGDGPITDLALRGTTWLAVSGASSKPPTAVTASAGVGLWRSEDAGGTWQAVPTSGAPWSAGLDSGADLVAFAGTTAVVVGQVDGGLAVWTGHPQPATAQKSQVGS